MQCVLGDILLLSGTTYYHLMMRDSMGQHHLKKRHLQGRQLSVWRQKRLQWMGYRLKQRCMSSELLTRQLLILRHLMRRRDFRRGGCFNPIVFPAILDALLEGAILGADVARSCRGSARDLAWSLSTAYRNSSLRNHPSRHRKSRRRMHIENGASLPAGSLEAIAVEEVAVTIARPTG